MSVLTGWGPVAMVCAWLGICLVCDLRTRQVPNLLTVLPFLLAALWRLMQSGWGMVLLVVGLVLITDLLNERWRVPLGVALTVTACAVGDAGAIPGLVGIGAVWLLWEIGGLGGADAKILIALILLTGEGWLLVWVALAGGLQGLAALLFKRKSIPYTVAIALGTAVWFLIQGLAVS